MGRTRDVQVCPACGAAIGDMFTHIQWHGAMDDSWVAFLTITELLEESGTLVVKKEEMQSRFDRIKERVRVATEMWDDIDKITKDPTSGSEDKG